MHQKYAKLNKWGNLEANIDESSKMKVLVSKVQFNQNTTILDDDAFLFPFF